MSRTGKWAMAAALGVGLAGWLVGSDVLRAAQAKGERARPKYQYVGVQQTVARVDLETGRIEILSKRGDPRASLLVRDSRPWAWRAVPMRGDRPAEHGDEELAGARPGEHPGGGADDDSP